MVEAWKPLTFADEAGPDAARLADPLAPAKRSQAALAKVHTRQLPDGSPAMSCGRLLAHRGGIVRNTVRPKAAKPGEATFTLATTPNAKPARALERLAMIAVQPGPDTPLRPQPVAETAKSSSPPGELRSRRRNRVSDPPGQTPTSEHHDPIRNPPLCRVHPAPDV